MTENEFFNILMDELHEFPESELHDIVSYYQSYFFYNLSIGKSQEEIINELGSPLSIAEGIINKNDNRYKETRFIDYQKKVNDIYKSTNCSINKNSDDSSEHNYPSSKSQRKINTNILLKLGIIILLIGVLLPILAGILVLIFNSCKLCIEVIIESLNLAVSKNFSQDAYYSIIPTLIPDLPKSALLLFSLGTMFMSIFFIFIIGNFFKLICMVTVNLLNKFKENKGDL